MSTIGSIFGTFFAGFFLIPIFGTRQIVLGITILLIILSVLLYRNKNKKYFALILIITLFAILFNFIGFQIFKTENPYLIEDVDSEYSRIWIKQIKGEDLAYKVLQVDTAIESYIESNTEQMGSKYLYYYDLSDYYLKDFQNTLMIGGAAYTYPTHYLNKYDDKKIDVSEIDKKMTELAVKHFNLDIQNERLGIYHQDGRSFLNTTKNKYDVILIDAFKGFNAPFELTTYEALTKCRNILNDNGIVITNIISSLEGEKSDFIKYEYTTYKKIFDDVKIFKVGDEENTKEHNLILMGIKGNTNINEGKYEEYKNLLDTEVKDYESDKPIVTDDYCPIGN